MRCNTNVHCGPKEFCDQVIHQCESCVWLCDPGRGTANICNENCKDYLISILNDVRTSSSTTVRQPNTDPQHRVRDSTQPEGLNIYVVYVLVFCFVIIGILISVFIIMIILKRYHKRKLNDDIIATADGSNIPLEPLVVGTDDMDENAIGKARVLGQTENTRSLDTIPSKQMATVNPIQTKQVNYSVKTNDQQVTNKQPRMKNEQSVTIDNPNMNCSNNTLSQQLHNLKVYDITGNDSISFKQPVPETDELNGNIPIVTIEPNAKSFSNSHFNQQLESSSNSTSGYKSGQQPNQINPLQRKISTQTQTGVDLDESKPYSEFPKVLEASRMKPNQTGYHTLKGTTLRGSQSKSMLTLTQLRRIGLLINLNSKLGSKLLNSTSDTTWNRIIKQASCFAINIMLM